MVIAKKKSRRGVVVGLFLYWTALVFWQNAREYTSRTTIDVVFKIGLLGVLVIYFFIYTNRKIRNIQYIFLFIMCTLPAFIMEPYFRFSTIIYYAFSWIFIFLTYGIGDECTINEKQYIWFLNGVILVALYAAIYALIFSLDQFKSAFTLMGAYGNELTSFFESSHEFGMYMSAAIISCFFCLENGRKKWFYVSSLIIFIPNLILTFSRTAIFSTAIFFIAYVLLGDNKKMRKRILIIGLITLIIYCISPTLQNFFLNVVNKKGNVHSRDILMETAMGYYKNASIFKQIFGSATVPIQTILSTQAKYASVHNAYVQILLYFGVVGLIWMIGFLLIMMKNRVKFYRKNRIWGNKFICLGLWCMALMVANTHLIFTSPIDCYFLTIYSVIVPKYVMNWVDKKPKSL